MLLNAAIRGLQLDSAESASDGQGQGSSPHLLSASPRTTGLEPLAFAFNMLCLPFQRLWRSQRSTRMTETAAAPT